MSILVNVSMIPDDCQKLKTDEASQGQREHCEGPLQGQT